MKTGTRLTQHRFVFAVAATVLFVLFVSSTVQIDTSVQRSTREHNVMSVLWFQTAAETRALQYQAFNIARWMLEKDLSENKSGKKKAVVVDIDETVLNNSPYEGRAIRINRGYPFEWERWIDLAQAEPIPGAVDFLQYAASRGVDVFYVTNRKVRDKKGTMENLQRKGFPQVEDSHLFLRTEESSKEKRRLRIAETHDIVLLAGDNLADFAVVFDRKGVEERNKEVDRLKNDFGKRFIILPNPIYGDWEDAIYGFQSGLSDSLKNIKRKEALQGF
ncbi:MAG TPA: 5'-nucleotidase, lipoprotein e(P4) family [Bacteroidota bacterium]